MKMQNRTEGPKEQIDFQTRKSSGSFLIRLHKMKNLLFPLAAFVSMSLAASGDDDLNALLEACSRRPKPPSPFRLGKDALHKDLTAEGSNTYEWYAANNSTHVLDLAGRIGLVDRVKDLQEAAKQAVEGGTTINGWKVREFPMKGGGDNRFLNYSFRGSTLYDSPYTFRGSVPGKAKAYAFEKNGMAFIATLSTTENVGVSGVGGAEIYLINDLGTKKATPMVFGVMKEFFRNEGYATGAKATSEILKALVEFSPAPDTSDIFQKWQTDQDRFLALGPKIDLRGIIMNIVALHRDQQELKGDRRVKSRFYYDDRGSLSVGDKFLTKDDTLIQARPGGKLIKIHEYGNLFMIVDQPRTGDNTVRLWIWDEDTKHVENYELPLSQDVAPRTLSQTERFLPIIYRRLLATKEAMEQKNDELENPN